MRSILTFLLCVSGLVACALAVWLFLLFRGGARHTPSALEATVARGLRRLAIPADVRQAKNPVATSEEVLAEGRAHFADHCAICHANDGSGDTEMGRGLYPPAPDMRQDATQSLSDGELWFIVHNGIPLSGMPAWGEDDPKDRDSWELVHFIRHLPRVDEDEIAEMEKMNPRSPHEDEEDEEARKFLEGGAGAPHEHEAGH